MIAMVAVLSSKNVQRFQRRGLRTWGVRKKRKKKSRKISNFWGFWPYFPGFGPKFHQKQLIWCIFMLPAPSFIKFGPRESDLRPKMYFFMNFPCSFFRKTQITTINSNYSSPPDPPHNSLDLPWPSYIHKIKSWKNMFQKMFLPDRPKFIIFQYLRNPPCS